MQSRLYNIYSVHHNIIFLVVIRAQPGELHGLRQETQAYELQAAGNSRSYNDLKLLGHY